MIGFLASTSTASSAYRSELTGIYAGLEMALAVMTLHNIKNGSLQVHCDNERCILLSAVTTQRIPIRTSHTDVLRLIRHVHAQLPINVTFNHIYGHQDAFKDFEGLSRPVQLNISCDQLAKAGLRRLEAQNASHKHILPHEQVVIIINHLKITGTVGPALRNEISRHAMRKHLEETNIMDIESFDKVDWESIELTMKELDHQYKIWIIKHVSGHCATNKMLQHRKQVN